MVDVMKAELMQRIKVHEGYRLDPYHCTEGFLTGGYGHKILQGEEVPTTKEGWDNLFEKDFNKAWDSMERLCAEHSLDIPNKAKGILCEMIFQMGFAGVSKFKMMIAALQQNNFVEAGRQMLDSRWAKQTPNRAQALSKQMEEV